MLLLNIPMCDYECESDESLVLSARGVVKKNTQGGTWANMFKRTCNNCSLASSHLDTTSSFLISVFQKKPKRPPTPPSPPKTTPQNGWMSRSFIHKEEGEAYLPWGWTPVRQIRPAANFHSWIVNPVNKGLWWKHWHNLNYKQCEVGAARLHALLFVSSPLACQVCYLMNSKSRLLFFFL